ncbi:hypothetical protein BESB_015740 [Besnoitia besnoiti]|uniref:Uncharacterized protein n=1 Tax=Besnoitia besnoiti TaxID=94643 RepID=A0A2A9M8L9_BESBE|nr:hypothetical protein BESB_015740 [Besnoitia besnoiti]PFH32256.1 hypothetical protein BESB_015740 [Besnoitia besnoiti]
MKSLRGKPMQLSLKTAAAGPKLPSQDAATLFSYCAPSTATLKPSKYPANISSNLFSVAKPEPGHGKGQLPGDCLPPNSPESALSEQVGNSGGLTPPSSRGRQATDCAVESFQTSSSLRDRFRGPTHVIQRRARKVSKERLESRPSPRAQTAQFEGNAEAEHGKISVSVPSRKPHAAAQLSDPGPNRSHIRGKLKAAPEASFHPTNGAGVHSYPRCREAQAHHGTCRALTSAKMTALAQSWLGGACDAVQSTKLLEREAQKHRNRARYLRREEEKILRELEKLRRKAKTTEQGRQHQAEKRMSDVLRIERQLQERAANRSNVKARKAEERENRQVLREDLRARKARMARARKEEYRKEREIAVSRQEEELKRKVAKTRLIQRQQSDARKHIVQVARERREELRKKKQEARWHAATAIAESMEELRKAEALEARELRRLLRLSRAAGDTVDKLRSSGLSTAEASRCSCLSTSADGLLSSSISFLEEFQRLHLVKPRHTPALPDPPPTPLPLE